MISNKIYSYFIVFDDILVNYCFFQSIVGGVHGMNGLIAILMSPGVLRVYSRAKSEETEPLHNNQLPKERNAKIQMH